MPYFTEQPLYIRPHGFPGLAPNAGSVAPVGTAYYWWYIGYTLRAFTPQAMQVFCGLAGSGAATLHQVSLARTPAAPNRASQILTVLQAKPLSLANSSPKMLTATGFALVPEAIHLWGGMRSQYGGTQPQLGICQANMGLGECLTTAIGASGNPGTTSTGTVTSISVTTRFVGILSIA